MPDDERHPEVGDLSSDATHYWEGDLWKWLPLWLVPDQVIQAARECYRFPATSATFLRDGLLNQSWRVEAGDEVGVLRVSRLERSRTHLEYEHAVTATLASYLPFVVSPLPGADRKTAQRAHGKLLSMYPFVAGVPATAVDPKVRSNKAAEALAQIHRVSLDNLSLPQRPGFTSADEEPRWIWSTIRPILARELPRTEERDELFAAIDRETTRLDAWIDDLHARQRPLRRALIHGDYNPRNLIFRDHDVVAVIDWDDCHVDAIVHEVAAASFAESAISPAAFWRTYLDCGGPLQARDVELLGGFARISALSELQWSVHDGRVIPSQALQLLRDLVRYLARLHSGEAELNPPA